MTFDEFQPRYKRLLKAYGKPLDEDTAERGAVYFEALKGVPEAVLEAAIAKVVTDERFFPAASVLRETANGILASKVYTPPACPQCHGDGFVEATDQNVQGVTYTNYVRRCPTCRPLAVKGEVA